VAICSSLGKRFERGHSRYALTFPKKVMIPLFGKTSAKLKPIWQRAERIPELSWRAP